MIERPFNQLRDTFKDANQKEKEMLKYVFEKSDSISLWIIGLSVGGISILANDIGKAKGYISPHLLSPILYLLVISVAAGIIYRVLFLRFFVMTDQIMNGVDIAFTRKKTMDTESSLTGDETYRELLIVVQRGTGEDHDRLIPLYEASDDKGEKILYDSMVKHYLANVAFAKRDTEIAFDFAMDTYAKFFGTTKEKYQQKIERASSSNAYKILQASLRIAYLVYNLAFIIALVLFAVSA